MQPDWNAPQQSQYAHRQSRAARYQQAGSSAQGQHVQQSPSMNAHAQQPWQMGVPLQAQQSRHGSPAQQPTVQPWQTATQPQQPWQQGAQPASSSYQPGTQPHNQQWQNTAGQRGYMPQQTMPTVQQGRGNHGGHGGGKPPKGNSKKGILVAIVALVLLVALTFGGVSLIQQNQLQQFVAQYDNVFCDGVYVDGIHLGGMTAQEGQRVVSEQAQLRDSAWYVTLTYQGEVVTTLTSAQLGMITDVTQALHDAWEQGHTGNAATRKADMEKLLTTPYHGYSVTPSGNTSVVDNVLETISGYVYVEPRDAFLKAFDPDQTYPFVFEPEVVGRMLETDIIKEQIYQMVATRQSGAIEVVPTTVQPSVTTAMLREKYVLRASATTKISYKSTEERTNNIRRSFEKMTGYILKPGETFSFNSVVGKRTVENGFFEAEEYANGEKRMGIGGGVCQASTTLYQAVVKAGLQIVTREPHSDAVNYADYGMDATVYWEYGRQIDFKFKNNTDSDIYIKARVESDPNKRSSFVAAVYIYGDGLGDGMRYELEARVIQELEPPAEPEYKKDTAQTYVTYTDEEYEYSKAVKGCIVESYRVTYVNDTVVERKLLYTDTFEARPSRVYVGTVDRGVE